MPGGNIYYEQAGKGRTVLLIHGGFGDRRMWDAQFNALARHFRVVRYDHRGFGKTTAIDSPYSPAEDIIQLLDHLGVSKAHVIGNSMGGAVALDLAVLYPQRVRKVVVVASGANGYPWQPADYASISAVFDAAKTQGVDKAAEMWRDNEMVQIASKHPKSRDLVWQMIQDNRNTFLLQHWPEGFKPSAYDRLSELRMPVLFVVGDKDMRAVQRVAAATAARVGGSQVIRMIGADHLPQMTHPDAFNKRVIAFLKHR